MKILLSAMLLCLAGTACVLKPESTAAGSGQTHIQPASEQAKQTEATMPEKGNELTNDYTQAELLGKVNPAGNTHFSAIEAAYTDKKGIYLRKECYEAFVRMAAAAQKAGFRLRILSAFRSFQDQKGIWENKWSGKTIVEGKNLAVSVSDPVQRAKTILRYSSMPGSSRHHWGTDLDLNSLDPAWFNTAEGKKLYAWLSQYAPEFGFCQPYTAKGENRPTGYEEEKWHWSYAPLSAPMLKAYLEQVKYADISGFLGSETAASIGIIENYVSGISTACK